MVDKASTESVVRMLVSCFAPEKADKSKRGEKRTLDDARIDEMNKEFNRPSKKSKESGSMWDFTDQKEALPEVPEEVFWNVDDESSIDEDIS